MNKQRTRDSMTQRIIRAGKPLWLVIWVACLLAAILGHSLYTVVLGAGSWSEELQESGMPAAAAASARAYVWELAELNRLDELGLLALPLERRLQRILADFITEQWMAEQLEAMQAGFWDVLQGKRETLPSLDVSPMKDKLTAELTRVIPYSVMQSLGWELVMPERIDMMTILKLDQAQLAEWRAIYVRTGKIKQGLVWFVFVWLLIGLAWHGRLQAALCWAGGGLLAAALLLLVLRMEMVQDSEAWAQHLLAYGWSLQVPATATALYNSVVQVIVRWLQELALVAASWTWRIAWMGILAIASGWIIRWVGRRGTAIG